MLEYIRTEISYYDIYIYTLSFRRTVFLKIVLKKLKIRKIFFKNPQLLPYIWTFDDLYLKNASSEGSKVKFSFYIRTGNL